MSTEHRTPMLNALFILVSLSLLAPVCLTGCKKEKQQPRKASTPVVTVEPVELKTVPVYLHYVATTQAVKTVTLKARVEGFLMERRFTEGADVEKGALVFVIERAPYEAALEKYKAQLEKDKAALAFAREQVDRYRPLAQEDFVTRETLDNYVTRMKEAAAAVEADRAMIKQAELDLSYCTMYAPIQGRIGRTLVNVGNLVGAGGQDTQLATIVQLDPIYAYFSPSEKDFRQILKYRKCKDMPVDIILSDGSTHPHSGKVDFIDNTADPQANTINMRAVVPNPEETLLPGIYVQARVYLCDVSDTPVITEKAIAEDQTGSYVYVVGKDNKVEKRSIQTGFVYNRQKIIWKGLKKGERIITEGLQMVRPGMTVQPQEPPVKEQGKAPQPAAHSSGPQTTSEDKHGKSASQNTATAQEPCKPNP
ncbi:MAG: efflux RND transporter periplasmic adaptor subunit [Deltaproteobacteria bacterium]|nr:efflux RND transporter periplasmic adaptor subunit [Deltaproteobacteria bacterium]